MGCEIVFSPAAESDFQEIIEYIAIENPDAALRTGQEIIRRLSNLSAHPWMGHVVPEFEISHLREISYPPFRIVYRVNRDESLVEVVRIWHAARGTPPVAG